MPGTLFVVSTPIGNLEDVTLRALRVLREVDLIAAEDTRRTANLMRHYEIVTRTLSLHEHNERNRIPQLLGRLAAGESVALVSDAGTPTVSDPGYRLVQAALRAGVRVESVPGPSAVLAALVMSGFPTDSFTFLGFVPFRAEARRRWLARALAEPRTVICFDSARRLPETLAAIARLSSNRRVAVARELTKLHESLVVGPIQDVLGHLSGPIKGEVTLVIGAQSDELHQEQDSNAQYYCEYCRMTNNGRSTRRDAIRAIARRHNVSAREVYRALEQQKM